jgi:hypothetical protein
MRRGNLAKARYYFSIMAATIAPAILDSENASFICSGVSISAASGRAGALPSLARVIGCRVSPDRRCVTLLLASTPGAALLDDIRRSGAIAVVFTQPSTHRTVQLKGSDARIVPPEVSDRDLAERYTGAFVAELAPLGHPEQIVRTLLAHEPDDMVTVQFTPSSAFSQTPGPSAGIPLAQLQGAELTPRPAQGSGKAGL